jgi:hypothetical protein
MKHSSIAKTALGIAALLALGACANPKETVVNNPATRASDRAVGTNVSGAYPQQSDGTPANPSGTSATRTFDRAAGTNTSGAYPQQSDGTPVNPPGTAASRTMDRAIGTDMSGAYPQNQQRR